MDGIAEVRQLDPTHLHWVAEFGGRRHEWDAEVTEQTPDERIAWRNVDGKDNAGVVTFHRIDEHTTRVMVQMDFVPEGVLEKIGDAVGVSDRRVRGDLQRFKDLVESRGCREPWLGDWRVAWERRSLRRGGVVAAAWTGLATASAVASARTERRASPMERAGVWS